MSTSHRRLSGPEFGALFSSFQRDAFRLEMLSAYDVGDDRERFRLYREGRPLPPPSQPDEEWQGIVRAAVTSGKTVARVHVLPVVLTAYLRYEIEWGYLYNAEAGERIMLLRRERPADFLPGWSVHDFWLFDGEIGVRMHYDEKGAYLYSELITDRSEVEQYCLVRDEAVAQAMTLQQYLIEVRHS
jgi:hypothetical protein